MNLILLNRTNFSDNMYSAVNAYVGDSIISFAEYLGCICQGSKVHKAEGLSACIYVTRTTVIIITCRKV